MQIWVDADACPQDIKEILFRAAERAQSASGGDAEPHAGPAVGGELLGGPVPFRQNDRFLTRRRDA